MIDSIKKQLTPKKFRAKELNQSKGILDDFPVRKNIDTREGTITKTPVNPYDIANKAYVDAGGGADVKVAIDSGATAGYLGAAANDGVLRTSTPLTYTDGGDFITLDITTTPTFEILNLNHASANTEVVFKEDTTIRAKIFYDIANNRLTIYNVESNAADAINFNDPITVIGTITGTNLNVAGTGHDLFSDFVANEHIDHTGVTLTAGTNMTGGGTIAANRTFNVALTTGTNVTGDHGTAATDQIVNVSYGTGDPPTANTTTIGSLYVQYTA